MQIIPRRLLVSAAGAVVALGLTSCAYDPYYSAVGGTYSSGYGQGYGYGGSNFSTSLFVTTGDPRWGYDPSCYSYYDYSRRSYYDPYLNGYYPVGYRPPVVIGVPHPYGWSPGRGYCPPPRNVRNVTVVNYRDRQSAYRNSNYSWANQVRTQPISQTHTPRRAPNGTSYPSPAGYSRSSPQIQAPSFGRTSPYSGANPTTRPSYGSPQGTRPSYGAPKPTRPSYGSPQSSRNYNPSSRNIQPQAGGRPDFRQQNSGRILPAPPQASGFPTRPMMPPQRVPAARSQVTPPSAPSFQGRPAGGSRPAPPASPQGRGRDRRGRPDPSSDHGRGIRSLGQG